MTTLEPPSTTSFAASAEQLRDRSGLPDTVLHALEQAPLESRLLLGADGGLSRVDQWIGPDWSVNQLRHVDPLSPAPGQLVPSVLLSAQVAATVAKVFGPMRNLQPVEGSAESVSGLIQGVETELFKTALFEVRRDDRIEGLVIRADERGPTVAEFTDSRDALELQPVRPIEAYAILMEFIDGLVNTVR